jgi:hypothetical protein
MTASQNSSEPKDSPSDSPPQGGLQGLSLQEKLELQDRLERRARTEGEGLRTIIRTASSRQRITAEAVFAYARLLIRTDDGYPVTPAPHHRLWVMLMCDRRIKQLLIVAPPESAKTTWAVSAFCGLHVGVFPEWPILIGSVSGDTAERRSISLRAMVTSPEWQACFPEIKPVRGTEGLSWQTHQWSVAPQGIPFPGRIHPSVSSVGTMGTVIGTRARLIIGDDLLDYDSTRTENQRETTVNWAHSSFFSREMAQVGRKILIGNAWHYKDLYARCREEGGWVVCHTPMLSESEDVYSYVTYPDDWPHPMIGESISGDPYQYVPA